MWLPPEKSYEIGGIKLANKLPALKTAAYQLGTTSCHMITEVKQH